MRLLGLHALEGAAAAGRAPRRGAADPGRGAGDRRGARRHGRARAPRRDHPQPRRQRPAAVARGPRYRALPRLGTAGRREARSRRRQDDRGAPRGLPRRRDHACAAADRRPRRCQAVDEPRGDHSEAGAREPDRDGRRRRRCRDEPGVLLARRRDHADRGRAAAPPARGGVRLRAGHGGAERAGRRHPHRPEGDRRAARRRQGVRHARRRRDRHGRRAAGGGGPQPAGRTASGSRRSGSSRTGTSRSTSTRASPSSTGST